MYKCTRAGLNYESWNWLTLERNRRQGEDGIKTFLLYTPCTLLFVLSYACVIYFNEWIIWKIHRNKKLLSEIKLYSSSLFLFLKKNKNEVCIWDKLYLVTFEEKNVLNSQWFIIMSAIGFGMSRNLQAVRQLPICFLGCHWSVHHVP